MPSSLGSALLLAGAMTAAAGGLGSGAPAPQAASSPRAFQVKVFILTRSTYLEVDRQGLVTPRRASLEPSQVEDIQAAIRDFASQVKQASGGALEPRVSVEEDSEQIAVLVPKGSPGDRPEDLVISPAGRVSSPWSQALEEGIGPRVNTALFEANDRIYRGPYDAVFVIHAGLDGLDRDFSDEGLHGRAIGWHTFTQQEPKAALTRELLKDGARFSKLYTAPAEAPSAPVYPSAFGEVEMAVSGSAVKATSSGIVARGGVRLAALKPGQTPILSFRARSSTSEPMALNLMGPSGPIASILLKGSRPGEESRLWAPHDAAGARLEARDDWSSFTLDLRQIPGWDQATELDMGTPLSVGRFEKGPPEHSVLEVADLALAAPGASGAMELRHPAPSREEQDLRTLVQALRGSEPLTQDELAKAQSLVLTGTSREQLSVLAAFMVRKDPKAVPMLLASATGAPIADAFVASRALAAQGSPEARTALSEALKKGPFETNRRFVAEVLTDPSASDLPILNMMMLQRGWRARLAAVEAISRIKSREAQLILVTSLAHEAEPSPEVRLAIARTLDTSFELASRRLLISGVNDPSNWVRAEALTRLLDSPFDQIKAEAMKGVRDDAPPVRISLLKAMTAKPSPACRPALRLAVTDPLPQVRAAALDAFAAQEGKVQSQEIENTFSDSSQEVQLALIRLAKKGKASLPARVIEALKASSNSEVKSAAQELGS